VIDASSHEVLKQVPQVSPSCPNIAVSPENDEVWITLKDVGKVQVFDARSPFAQRAVLNTGPITNHVNFVTTATASSLTSRRWRYRPGDRTAEGPCSRCFNC